MIHTITTNPITPDSIKSYQDNFIIVHLYQKMMLPLSNSKLGYVFEIYHQDGMDMSEFEEYLNEPNFEFNFIPVEGYTTALDMVVQSVLDQEVDLELDAEEAEDDKPDEITFAVCTYNIKTNRQVCAYLNKSMKEQQSEIKTLDLYKYLKKTKIGQIEDLIKMQLMTDFVYPDDPVAFGYCLANVLNGVIL